MLEAGETSNSFHAFNEPFERTARHVADHVVNGAPTIAGVSQIDLVYDCARRIGVAPKRPSFEKVRFAQAITVNADRITIGVNLTLENDRCVRFDVLDEQKNVCSTGRLAAAARDRGQELPMAPGQGRLLMSREDIEAYFARRGSTYGRTFQGLDTLWVNQDYVLAAIVMARGIQPRVPVSAIHPTIVDAALQSTIGIIEARGLSRRADERFIPFYIDKLACFSLSWEGECYFSRVEFVEEMKKSAILVFDISLFDRLGRQVMQISRFCLKRL